MISAESVESRPVLFFGVRRPTALNSRKGAMNLK